MKQKEKNNKEEQKDNSFVSLAGEQKISLRIKVTLAQLQALDNKEEVEVSFKGRKLQLKCLGKAE